MIPSIILGALAWQAGPAPQSLPEDARALLDRMAGAAAVEMEFLATLETPAEDMQVKGELRLGGPKSGTLRLSVPEEPAFTVVGDGERVVLLDPSDKTWMPIGESFQGLFTFATVLPLDLWSGQYEPGQLHGRWLEMEPAHPLLRVLELRLREEAPPQRLWFGADDRLLALTTRLGDENEGGAMHVYFHRADFLAKADEAEYRGRIPDGYEEFQIAEGEGMPDYEAKLLEIGAAAPEVTVQGMDDREFTLASLRGKTVLLNFWFYH